MISGIRFDREWVQFDLPPAVRWQRLEASPYNPFTSEK